MDALALALALAVGLLAGTELAVGAAFNPILDGLGQATLRARTHAAAGLGRIMPFAYAAVLVLLVASLLTLPHAGRLMLVAALVVYLVVGALTLGYLVPRNVRTARWDPSAPPADWREQLRAWDRGHAVRVVLLIVTFALVLLAVM